MQWKQKYIAPSTKILQNSKTSFAQTPERQVQIEKKNIYRLQWYAPVKQYQNTLQKVLSSSSDVVSQERDNTQASVDIAQKSHSVCYIPR